MALGALKVSARHFRPVDYFEKCIFRFSMKNVKKWCVTRLRYTNFNLTCFQEGVINFYNLFFFPVMVFAVVEKAGTTVMMDGEELDSWSVIINGEVRIDFPNTRLPSKYLRCGHR